MDIKTGCFFYKYDMDDAILISIARSDPKFFKGYRIPDLAPTYNILNDYKLGKIDDNEYTERYKSTVLNYINKDGIIKHIKAVAESYDVSTAILCCWEKTGFCHRHIVADWLGIEEAEHQ